MNTPEAVCHRCGSSKRGPFVPCKSCRFEPRGEDRSVAWLFSRAWLSAEELELAAQRIRDGQTPDVPQALRDQARVEMGAVPRSNGAQKPLTVWQLLCLLVANMMLTPLAGFAIWYGLRENRPLAARQALRTTVPVAVGFTIIWSTLFIDQIVS